MSIFIEGISLKFYRGIGPIEQKIYPLQKFNLFVGANNSGKSIILNFISEYISEVNSGSLNIDELEVYKGSKTGLTEYSFAISQKTIEAEISSKYEEINKNTSAKSAIDYIIKTDSNENVIWFNVDSNGRTKFRPDVYETLKSGESDNSVANSMYALWLQVKRGSSGGGYNQHWLPESLEKIESLVTKPSGKADLIPAIREIGKAGIELKDLSGQGLIDKLAEIQSPDHDKREDHQIFERINTFLQTVTGKKDAKIEVPHGRNHILVHIDNKVLPLKSLGTGIEEVIMIAVACTINDDQIMCIEEPEIHLHPLLQRRLITYLDENTNNQYFIATHSASLIDTPGASIFHVKNDGIQTYVEHANLRNEKHSICQDLGYRASDILQSNFIIWVEGPSDRIYLLHWISISDDTLKEGIHFSIMFYGGRLLSHLSGHSEIDGFINLRALNQNVAIMIDSDRDCEEKEINATKKRLIEEFGENDSFAWVTDGREIENYVDHTLLQEAVSKTHPKHYSKASAGSKYAHALYFIKKNGEEYKTVDEEYKTVDKVAVAKSVCENITDLEILDLKDKVTQLVKKIRNANL